MRYLLLFPFLFSFFVFSQGTDCSTAILVSSNGCSGTTAYTNTGITGNVIPTCFGTGNNNAMWFKFVASAPTVTITVNGTGLTQPMIALLDQPPTPPCTGTFPELSCTNVFTGTSASLTNSSLVIGNVYYIIVDGKTNTAGTFQLCLTSTARPVNDDPCNAISLQANNFCSPIDAYSNAGATGENLTSVSIPSCMETTSLNTVYFKFTAIGTSNTILINGSATGLNRPQAFVLGTTLCSGTTYSAFACSQAASGVNTLTLTANSLIPGNTYYILVDGYSTNTGAFQICVNSFAPTSTVVNDECSTATVLCPNSQYFSTTKGATINFNTEPIADGASGEWQCNGVSNETVWFSFITTTPASDINFSINSNCIDLGAGTYPDGGSLQFEVFKRSDGLGGCANRVSLTSNGAWDSQGCSYVGPGVGSNTLSIDGSTLSPNTKYYLIVDNYPDCGCDFNFIISGNQGTSAGADDSKCLNEAPYTFTGFTPTGGTWSGPGITNAATGLFSPTSAGIGTHTLYYTNGNCTDSKVVTVTSPTVTVSNDVSICTGGSTNIIGNVTAVSTQPLSFTNSTAFTIPDGGVSSSWTGNTTGTFATSSITPTGLAAGYTFKSIVLNITHTWDSDVIAYLTNSCGETIRLINGNGGSGDNFTNTTFTPSSTIWLPNGSAPFTGSFIPNAGNNLTTSATLWAAFCACQNTSAAWTLKVGDKSSVTTGTLVSWTLNFVNNFPPPTYQWSSAPASTIPNSTTSLSQTVSPTVTTAYTLTATDYFGCVNTDVVNVTVAAAVVPTITSTAATCSAAEITSIANFATYATGTTFTFTPTGPSVGAAGVITGMSGTTAYTVTATSGGCTSAASLSFSNDAMLVSPIYSSISVLCSGPALTSVTVNATVVSPGTMQYSLDGITFQSSNVFTSGMTLGSNSIFYIRKEGTTCVVNSGPQPINCNCSTVTDNTITAPQTICSGIIPASLTGSIPSIIPAFASTYQWQTSTDDATWMNISLATAQDYAPGALTQSTYYRRVVKMAGCPDDNSASVMITVNATPVFTNVTVVCSGLTFTSATVNATLTSGTMQYSLDGTTYQSSNVFTTGITVGVSQTFYIRTVGSTCSTSGSQLISCSCSTVSGNTISADQSICSGVAPASLIGNTAVISPTFAFTYQWQSSVDNLTWTDISLETAKDYAPGALTQSTYYRRVVKMTGCPDDNSTSVMVTVSAAPNLVITNPATVCSPLTVDITDPLVTALSTGGGNLSYFTDPTATTILPNTTAITTSATYYIKSSNGVCSDVEPVVITITPTPTVTVTDPAAVCSPSTVSITNAGIVNISSGATPSPTFWTDNLATSALANPSAINASGIYYIKAANGACSEIKPVNVVVNIKPSLVIITPAAVCTPLTVDITDPNVTSGSTGGGTLSYWTDAFTLLPLGSPSAVSTSGIYYIKSTTVVGGCTDVKPVTVTVNTTPVLNIVDPTAVCAPIAVDITKPAVTLGSTGNGVLSYFSDALAITPLANSSAITTSGVYYIKSTATGNCSTIQSVNVTVNTSPVLVITDPSEVCEPAMIDLTNPKVILGSSQGAGIQIGYYSNISGTAILTTPTSIRYSGTYYIKITQNGCSTISPVKAVINPKPKANFTPTPAIVTTINPVSKMVNNTIGAVAYSWIFNDGGVSGETSPEYTFPSKEQSEQLVILIATSDKGCKDTTSKIIIVNEELLYYVPNTFTPDDDNFNQVFKPVFTSGYSPTSYHLIIFDRWGEIVFESYDPEIGWEGKLGKDGNTVQVGTYTWKIQFKLKEDDRRKEILGYVNIIK